MQRLSKKVASARRPTFRLDCRADREIVETLLRLADQCDTADPRHGRPGFTPAHHLRDRFRRSLQDGLHRTVTAIANPSVQSMGRRLSFKPRPIAHALHAAFDLDMNCSYICHRSDRRWLDPSLVKVAPNPMHLNIDMRDP